MEAQDDFYFISKLREHGLQVTYQRLAIYKALCNSGAHPSAEEIHLQVGRRFSMISLGTIYKTLERFHEAGLVDKVNPATEVARYDAKVGPHHHFVCVRCHSIFDLDDDANEAEEPPLPELSGFKVLKRRVLFQGYCPACRPDKQE